MNFSPFTGHFPATIPTIHQFAAKFSHDGSANALGQGQEANRYHSANVAHFNQHHAPIGMAVNVAKFRQPENIVSIGGLPNSVSNGNGAQQNLMHSVNTGGIKYQTIATSSSVVGINNIANQYSNQITIPYSQHITTTVDTIQQQQQQQNNQQILKTEQRSNSANNDKVGRENNGGYQQRRDGDIMQQEMMNANMLHAQAANTTMQNHQQQAGQQHHQTQQLVVVLHEPKDPKIIKQEHRIDRDTRTIVNNGNDFLTWQSLAAPGSAVADYLSTLPASALPLGLHHLLKYSSGDGKRDADNLLTAAVAANGLNAAMPANVTVVQTNMMGQSITGNIGSSTGSKKKKKKKPPKEKKPRPKPGEIRLTTALDGSTLYCCPECHMAYPERGMLEQHLVGHTMERRFICDICNAALKRKDHLTRHKQSHNPERPFVCSVCLKAFKRKEQLTLHFVIHSGEKRHICQECGKGFYRKDHLRKHTRSHIARRVKAELSQQGAAGGALARAVPAPAPSPLAAPLAALS